MTANTDEEHLNNLIDAQSENLTDEITPTVKSETINSTQETKNMEVHKLFYHVTHKKNGSNIFEYFVA